MLIGSLFFNNNLVLAPMAGVTDRPFRILCRRLGAGLAVSEMIKANDQLFDTLKTRQRSDFSGEPGPCSVQIVGSDPEQMALAAKVNADRGADIIDINMGCPAKKVCRKAAGSALLADPDLVARILDAVVGAVSVPVTLKIRTGVERSQRNAVQIAKIAEQAGVAALAIHGRTRADRFTGEAEYQTIADVVAQVSLPVLANGDIDSGEKARRVLQETGAQGLLIGRAAQGNPWIFQQICAYLEGREITYPSAQERADVLAEHLEQLYSFYGVEAGLRIARKHIGWYVAGHPGAKALRDAANQALSARAQQQLIQQFFTGESIEVAA